MRLGELPQQRLRVLNMKGLLLCHVVPQRYRERRRRGGEFLFKETIARHYVNFWGFIIKFEGKKGATTVCGEKIC